MATHPDSPDARSSDDSGDSWDEESPPPSEYDDKPDSDCSNCAALACAKGITNHISAGDLSDSQIKRIATSCEAALRQQRAVVH